MDVNFENNISLTAGFALKTKSWYRCPGISVFVAILLGQFSQSAHSQSVHRASVQILVGPTVHVSKAFADLPHYENLAAGDPEHPGRLITCAQVFPSLPGKARDEHCYISFDGGKSWKLALEVSEGSVNGDPAIVYGGHDHVYVVSLVIKGSKSSSSRETKTVVYRSTDGGRTWKESSRFPFVDREYIAIDRTGGKYDGRLYIWGVGMVKGIAGDENSQLQIYRSLDDGVTFLGPTSIECSEGTSFAYLHSGVVLSDGTLALMFSLIKKGRQTSLEQEPLLGPNAELHLIKSRDGGEAFTKSQKITEYKADRQRSEGGNLGQLAVDSGSKQFKDRLYAVFPSIVSDRIQIQLSYSSDLGATWSKPVTVNDDRSPEQGGNGPDHLLPSVAVNKGGVVLVTWYDRREAKDNLGWRIRGAVSLDGGETFSSSVAFSDTANAYPATTPFDLQAFWGNGTLSVSLNPFFANGGHTSGLAVDADGTFHPTWIDNHTGIAQLWSATVKIVGTVVKHGDIGLAELDDVSKSITLELSNPLFDRLTGTLSITAQLRNTSTNTIEGPIKVRCVAIESDIGVPEVIDADNRQIGTGAVWDFSPQIVKGGLLSMSVSSPKTLRFKLSDLRRGKDFHFKLLTLDARVFGRVQK
jgi:hypothetical protein